MDQTIKKAFESILSGSAFLTDPQDMAGYLTEWRDRYQGKAIAVARPQTTEEVAQTVKLAAAHGLKIIPQSGNTGLVGGQVAQNEKTHLILSLDRMQSIREVDPLSNTMTVDAGVTLKNIQDAAEDVDRLFPLSLASEGICRIGGNLSTNAGGINVLAYGSTRDLCLGLEVVLADGRIWNGLRKLKKDNTGYDLKDLFIGAEGTLGIITGAVLKLFPKPVRYETFFCAMPSVDAALSLLNNLGAKFGSALTSYELISKFGVELSVRHGNAKRPIKENDAPWYILGEVSLGREDGDEADILMHVLEEGFSDDIILDAVLAQSSQQRLDFWHLREALSSSQKPEGGSIKNDISVPVSKIPEFVQAASSVVESILPGARPVPFGHMGDGNLHYNISQPVGMNKQEYLSFWDEMTGAVDKLVLEFNGSISAEHGIGMMKRDKMADIKSDVELDLMRRVKQALDPEGLMNPGKMLPICDVY